ncbi:hypothetical protein BDZ89DRAFT_1071833, partial [Hymenopellis radicata]
ANIDVHVSRRVKVSLGASSLLLAHKMSQYFHLFNIDKCIYSEEVYTDASMDELHSDVFRRDLDESAPRNPCANIGAFIQIL